MPLRETQRRARPEVVDTSVLIPYFRSGEHSAALRPLIEGRRLFLPALVALELYAGTRDQQEKRALDEFVGGFARRGRVLTATQEDHTLAGVMLARRRRIAGELQVRDHLVDVLIVLCASQVGGTVLTNNVRHLETWAALARRAGRDVRASALDA